MRRKYDFSCRLRNPDEFQQDTLRRIHSGKIDVITGRPRGMKKTRAQALLYPIELWSEKTARASCRKRKGKFVKAEVEYEGELLSGAELQPWQMTQEEYLREKWDDLEAIKNEIAELKAANVETRRRGRGRGYGYGHQVISKREDRITVLRMQISVAGAKHRAEVVKAIKVGEQIPTKVLKDYPDMQKRVKPGKPKPLPKDAENPQDVKFNSDEYTCKVLSDYPQLLPKIRYKRGKIDFTNKWTGKRLTNRDALIHGDYAISKTDAGGYYVVHKDVTLHEFGSMRAAKNSVMEIFASKPICPPGNSGRRQASKTKPLPKDAQSVQEVKFNSDEYTCYGKPVGKGYRAYCRRRK